MGMILTNRQRIGFRFGGGRCRRVAVADDRPEHERTEKHERTVQLAIPLDAVDLVIPKPIGWRQFRESVAKLLALRANPPPTTGEL